MDEKMDGSAHDRQDTPTYDIVEDIDALRAALAAHGITLPSLGVDPLTLAGWTNHPPLVALGNCTVVTARRLTDALRVAAGG
ncbi:hypothetical protein P8A22_23180 [Streptomyces laculatispora]|uniref:Uncharacterized protein n=1 Tax=Streptomyces laculatispora TaxID=887464 RepID=A0ABY9I6T1_9ACTN|nr:hypothetical protein [Streptomyces laculatispora]WLQ42590.1 hypothetical protein P8A22_23180 [Streptomyces laculatispora]